jgi:hypothetical protein
MEREGIKSHWDSRCKVDKQLILTECYIDKFYEFHLRKFKDLPILVKGLLRAYWSMK